jgi:hypothetical protein
MASAFQVCQNLLEEVPKLPEKSDNCVCFRKNPLGLLD